MKKCTLLLLAATLMFAACAGKKKVTSSQSLEVSSVEQTDKRTDLGRQLSTTEKTDVREQKTEQIEDVTITRKYDTDKPVDVVTGQHPIKSETFNFRRAATNADTHGFKEINAEEQLSITNQDNSRREENLTAASQITTKQKKNPPWGWLVAVAAAVLIAGYVSRRILKKYF